MQSTERPNDFKKDPVKDLRDKPSTGFPLEEKDFHKKIPKIEIAENPADETIIQLATLNTDKTIADKKELMKNIGDYLRKIYGDWENKKTGFMTLKSESGKGGSGTISSGKGDPGGPSYGSYQLSSYMGKLLEYVKQSKYKDELSPYAPWSTGFGNTEKGKKNEELFNAKWREIATKHPDEFEKDQYKFVSKDYAAQLKKLKEKNIDLYNKSEAVQEIIFSTSTQHGPNTDVITEALAGKNINNLSDKEIISIIQDDKLKHVEQDFPKAPPKTRNSIRNNRIPEEKKDALKMLEFKELKEEIKQLEKQKEQLESQGKLA